MEFNLGKEPNTGKEQKFVVIDVTASLRGNRNLLNKDGSVIITGKEETISLNNVHTHISPLVGDLQNESAELIEAREIAKQKIGEALIAYAEVLGKENLK